VNLSPPLTGGDVLGIVGRTFEGRKGVVDVLTGGHDDGQGGGGRGGVEECGNFVVIYVNVGKSVNRKYRNEFWVDKNLGRGRGVDGNGKAVLMSWFSGMGSQGGIHSVAGILAAAIVDETDETDETIKTDEIGETTDEAVGEGAVGADGDGGGEGVTADVDAAATNKTTTENTTTENTSTITTTKKTKTAKKTAVLFLRTYRGPYVCCGRLRAAATKQDRQTGMRVDFQLADAEALVASGHFDALIGEYLTDPEDRALFSIGGGNGATGGKEEEGDWASTFTGTSNDEDAEAAAEAAAAEVEAVS
jgi:hypothetical protein